MSISSNLVGRIVVNASAAVTLLELRPEKSQKMFSGLSSSNVMATLAFIIILHTKMHYFGDNINLHFLSSGDDQQRFFLTLTHVFGTLSFFAHAS